MLTEYEGEERSIVHIYNVYTPYSLIVTKPTTLRGGGIRGRGRYLPQDVWYRGQSLESSLPPISVHSVRIQLQRTAYPNKYLYSV